MFSSPVDHSPDIRAERDIVDEDPLASIAEMVYRMFDDKNIRVECSFAVIKVVCPEGIVRVIAQEDDSLKLEASGSTLEPTDLDVPDEDFKAACLVARFVAGLIESPKPIN